MRAYLIRLLVSVNQFFNCLTFGNPDETISSRVGKAAEAGNKAALIAESVINALFFWDPNHCRRVIERDEA